ncbi:D-amino-acid transaminase, chloroplastic-like [Phalaenopsis equestris]|uniref:D-amino-acid transaminase, chloroplastic-like n=1 Tax=Phalaenopsis equestris TaxID=78828 RepID=UPI0009E2DD89|nr:D-amino-acid transaminase, chloroplastic-like [Phalaenopsis equestris]
MALPCQPTPPPTLQKSSPSSSSFSSSSTFSPIPSLSTENGSFKYSSKPDNVIGFAKGHEKWQSELSVPVYSTSEVIEKMRSIRCNETAEEHPCRAMYSSLIGGIILDPALMVIPIDDHMVHRGHGVFDTAMLMNGCLYDLDSHLDRFLKSASSAKISPPYPRETIKGIIFLLAAASKLKTGSIRYWLSSGPGDFLLSPPSKARPTFYSVAIAKEYNQKLEGVKVITTTIPTKPPKFATMKTVNYLPNVLSKMEAEEMGVYSSIWVDEQGYVAEGPNCNIAFVSKERELLLPKPDRILHGCTAKRLLILASKLIGRGILKSVITRDISVEEAKGSAEMMFVSSLIPIMAVVDWDGEPIGDGNIGEVTQAISDLFWEDIIAGTQMLRTKVAY